ncbi:MAG: HlyD family efflux transporter periplasmic adaptor subunit [Planctomycetia bacterium]|nr:HlyD family efflux transporter periplasmic adaptor subunit [Planctomycetia bacterium]
MKRNSFCLSVILFLLFGLSGNAILFSQTGGFGRVRKLDPQTGRPYVYKDKKPTNWLTNESSPLYSLPDLNRKATTKQLSNRVIPQVYDVTKSLLPHSAPTKSTIDFPNPTIPTSAIARKIVQETVEPNSSSELQESIPANVASQNVQETTALTTDNQLSLIQNIETDNKATNVSSLPIKKTEIIPDNQNGLNEQTGQAKQLETEKIAEIVPLLEEGSSENNLVEEKPNISEEKKSPDETVNPIDLNNAASNDSINIESEDSVEMADLDDINEKADSGDSKALVNSASLFSSEISSNMPSVISPGQVDNSIGIEEQIAPLKTTQSTNSASVLADVSQEKDGMNSVDQILHLTMTDWQSSAKIREKIRDIRNQSSNKSLYQVARLQTELNEEINRNEYLSRTPNTILPSRDSGSPSLPNTNISAPPSGSSQTFIPSPSPNAFSAPSSSINPSSSSLETFSGVNYGPMIDSSQIPMQPGDILVEGGKVMIPTGEGYEALVSSNTQGLLTQLGIEALDAQGNPILDENGKAQIIPLKRGMKVSKGQILARQKDDELLARRQVADYQLVVAKMEAEKELEIEVADSAALVAQSAYYRAKAANDRVPGAVTPEEMTEKAFDWKRAEKTAEKSRYDIEVKKHEVNVAQAQVLAANSLIEDKKLLSPIDGIIDDIFQNEGQWLREGDKVLKIIRLDKVQVLGRIDASSYTPEMIDGKNVTIYFEKPGMSIQTLEGKITYVRQFIEFSYYNFYCEVENKVNEKGYWLLNPEALVYIVIHQ